MCQPFSGGYKIIPPRGTNGVGLKNNEVVRRRVDNETLLPGIHDPSQHDEGIVQLYNMH